MKQITLNGKTYPCRITMGAMLRFKRETGHDVGQMTSADVSELVVLLWCCIASACKADGVEFGMELMDFADALEPTTLTDFYNSMDGGSEQSAQKKTEQTS